MYDATIQSDHIFTRCDEIAPPRFLDLSFQFATDGTVIVKAGVAVVDFATGKDQSPSFAQTNNLVHGVIDGQWFDLGCLWLLFLFFFGGRVFGGFLGRRKERRRRRWERTSLLFHGSRCRPKRPAGGGRSRQEQQQHHRHRHRNDRPTSAKHSFA